MCQYVMYAPCLSGGRGAVQITRIVLFHALAAFNNCVCFYFSDNASCFSPAFGIFEGFLFSVRANSGGSFHNHTEPHVCSKRNKCTVDHAALIFSIHFCCCTFILFVSQAAFSFIFCVVTCQKRALLFA